MSKSDLFKKALKEKLIPEDSLEKDFTVDSLKKVLKKHEDSLESQEGKEGKSQEEEIPKKLDTKAILFKKAVSIKAVPVGAKIENYNEPKLEAIIENHEKNLANLKKQEAAEERVKKEDKERFNKK